MMSMNICLSACLPACLPVQQHISGTTRAIFAKFFVRVAYVRDSILVQHVDDRPHRLLPGRGCTACAKCNIRLPCYCCWTATGVCYLLLNSVYHRSRNKLHSRRIVPASKDELTEYRSLWRCCQPPRLVSAQPSYSCPAASPVKSDHDARCSLVDDERIFSSPCHCVGGQHQQPLHSTSKSRDSVSLLSAL